MDRDDWDRRDETSELSPGEVVADLAGGGLDIEGAERVTRSVATADRTRPAIDALVRARRPAAQ